MQPPTGRRDAHCAWEETTEKNGAAQRAFSGTVQTMEAPRRPAIHGVIESILYADDLARAVMFYRDTLGFAVLAGDGERFQALDAGGRGVLLLFKRGGTLTPMHVPGSGVIPPHDGRGPHHIAFAIDDVDYGDWRVRLMSAGVAIESETQWGRGGRSLYFRDPDGHLVELVTPGIWANY